MQAATIIYKWIHHEERCFAPFRSKYVCCNCGVFSEFCAQSQKLRSQTNSEHVLGRVTLAEVSGGREYWGQQASDSFQSFRAQTDKLGVWTYWKWWRVGRRYASYFCSYISRTCMRIAIWENNSTVWMGSVQWSRLNMGQQTQNHTMQS